MNPLASARIAVIPGRCGLAVSTVPSVSSTKLDSQKASVSLTIARLRVERCRGGDAVRSGRSRVCRARS